MGIRISVTLLYLFKHTKSPKMKTIIFFSIALLFITCSKDGTNGSNNNSYIKLTAGNKQIQYSGNYTGLILSGTGTGMFKLIGNSVFKTQYQLKGQTGLNNALLLSITTDSLMQKTYSLPTLSLAEQTILVIDGKDYASDYSNTDRQTLALTVNSYSNGIVSGTFSGEMFLLDVNQTTPQDSIQVNGEFKDIQVVY